MYNYQNFCSHFKNSKFWPHWIHVSLQLLTGAEGVAPSGWHSPYLVNALFARPVPVGVCVLTLMSVNHLGFWSRCLIRWVCWSGSCAGWTVRDRLGEEKQRRDGPERKGLCSSNEGVGYLKVSFYPLVSASPRHLNSPTAGLSLSCSVFLHITARALEVGHSCTWKLCLLQGERMEAPWAQEFCPMLCWATIPGTESS